jgi:hypothetical protein
VSLLMPERLYKLLPAIHRLRDAEQGEQLRALLGVMETEFERIEQDIAILYDNWFIETCDEWVVPYIGDLLGVRPIRPVPSAGVSARAYVANTIAYRRRKGTAVVLEQLARDVTGWPARAVEFFQRLTTTAHTNHVRLTPPFTANVRQAAAAELANGAFDPFAHTADVRSIVTRGGRFNIPNVGLFLWRLRSYPVGAGVPGDEAPDFVSARDLGAWWSLHPAGVDAPLFNPPRTETTITHLAEEENVPGPLRRLALNAELERLRMGIAEPAPRFMTATAPVLRIFLRLAGETTPVEVRREDIYLCEIPDEVEFGSPMPRALALDPARGRIAFPAGLAVQDVWVQASYGFSGDLGGGPYDRSASVRAANAAVSIEVSAGGVTGGFNDPAVWQVGVSHLITNDRSGRLFPSLSAAVEAWNRLPAGRTGVIVLMDSLSDTISGGGSTPPAAQLEIELGERSRLLIVAGTWPREPIPGGVGRVPGHFDAQRVRAHFVGDIVLRGTAADASLNPGACFINGLLLEGHLVVAPGNLGGLTLAHSSVIPGHGEVFVQSGGNNRLELTVDHTICAAISVPGPIAGMTVSDSIVGNDSGSPDLSVDAPETSVELLRSSFFGGVAVQSVRASDCIFDGVLRAERRQSGCIRFSYLPPGSAAPRRYRCQPQLEAATRIGALRDAALEASLPLPTEAQEAAVRAEVAALIRPLFVSRRYGDPGYGQLELRCAMQIRTGAESGAEMGAFEFLQQPQREANLRDTLAEYLRFGLEAGLFYVT